MVLRVEHNENLLLFMPTLKQEAILLAEIRLLYYSLSV